MECREILLLMVAVLLFQARSRTNNGNWPGMKVGLGQCGLRGLFGAGVPTYGSMGA